MHDMKAETALKGFKKWIATHNSPDSLQTDNGSEFKNQVLERFCKIKNIERVFGVPNNPQHQGAVEECNQTIQNFLISAKDHQQKQYNLEDSISDFLIYYNDGHHSTTKVAPYKIMINVEDQELVKKLEITL